MTQDHMLQLPYIYATICYQLERRFIIMLEMKLKIDVTQEYIYWCGPCYEIYVIGYIYSFAKETTKFRYIYFVLDVAHLY